MGDYHNLPFGPGSMPYAPQNTMPYSQSHQQMYPQQHAMQMPQQHAPYAAHPNPGAYQHTSNLSSGNYGQSMPPFPPGTYWGHPTQASPIAAQSPYQAPQGYGVPFPTGPSPTGYATTTPIAVPYPSFPVQHSPYAQQQSQSRSQAPQTPSYTGFPNSVQLSTQGSPAGLSMPFQTQDVGNEGASSIATAAQSGGLGVDGWPNEPRPNSNLRRTDAPPDVNDVPLDSNSEADIADNEPYSPSLPANFAVLDKAEMRNAGNPGASGNPSGERPVDRPSPAPANWSSTSQLPPNNIESKNFQPIHQRTAMPNDRSYPTQSAASITKPSHVASHPDWVRKFVTTLAENGYNIDDMAGESPSWTEFEINQLRGLFDDARVHLAQAKARVAAAKFGQAAPKRSPASGGPTDAELSGAGEHKYSGTITQNTSAHIKTIGSTDLPGLPQAAPSTTVNTPQPLDTRKPSPPIRSNKAATPVAKQVTTDPTAAAAKRQEYIQKLLALKKKAGDSAQVGPTATTSEIAPTIQRQASLAPQNDTSTATTSLEADRHASATTLDAGALAASDASDKEEKKRKQTELARQRLEAHLQRQKSQGTPKQTPSYPQPDHPDPHDLPRPASSTGVIPGLSLLETIPRVLTPSHVSQAVPTVAKDRGTPKAVSSPLRSGPNLFSTQLSASSNKRRRPVASDFDEFDAEPFSKRPSFTTSRSGSYGQVGSGYGGYDMHERTIIHLSDDDEEDEEEEGELLEDSVRDSADIEAAVAGLVDDEMRKGTSHRNGFGPPLRPLPALSGISATTITRSRAPADSPSIPSGAETPNVLEKEQEIERLKREIAAKEALRQARLKAKLSLKKSDALGEVKADSVPSLGRTSAPSTIPRATGSISAALSPRASLGPLPSSSALSDSHVPATASSPSPYREISVRAKRKEELQRKMQQLEEEERRRREEKEKYLQELMEISDDMDTEPVESPRNDLHEADSSNRPISVPTEAVVLEAALPDSGPAFEAIPGSAESAPTPDGQLASQDGRVAGWEDQDLYDETPDQDDVVDNRSASSNPYDGGANDEALYNEDDDIPDSDTDQISDHGEAMDMDMSDGEIAEDSDAEDDQVGKEALLEIDYGSEPVAGESHDQSSSAHPAVGKSTVTQDPDPTILRSGSAPMEEESSTGSGEVEEDFYEAEEPASAEPARHPDAPAVEEDDSDDYDPEDIIGEAEAALETENTLPGSPCAPTQSLDSNNQQPFSVAPRPSESVENLNRPPVAPTSNINTPSNHDVRLNGGAVTIDPLSRDEAIRQSEKVQTVRQAPDAQDEQEKQLMERKRAERNALLRARLEALRQIKPSPGTAIPPAQPDVHDAVQPVTTEGVQAAPTELSGTSEPPADESMSESEESEAMDIESTTPEIQIQAASQEAPSELSPAVSVPQPAAVAPLVSRFQHYTAYESPLRMFKSYRYHPDYSHTVHGGFRSLTYSNNINPDQPICPNDVDGTCTDPNCQKGQHWNKMGLSDDLILVQLGTKNPGQTEDERKKWTEGLKEVVKVLRQRGVNDPELVAKEIANYRRQFLGDETRVLNL